MLLTFQYFLLVHKFLEWRDAIPWDSSFLAGSYMMNHLNWFQENKPWGWGAADDKKSGTPETRMSSSMDISVFRLMCSIVGKKDYQSQVKYLWRLPVSFFSASLLTKPTSDTLHGFLNACLSIRKEVPREDNLEARSWQDVLSSSKE